MNKSYSKIRHIQESNLKLEERLIQESNLELEKSLVNEDIYTTYLKRRLITIEELIDKYINMVDEEDYSFGDEFEFANNIISWVVNDLENLDDNRDSPYDYDEIQDLIKDNFGEYILSSYVGTDDDDDE